MSKHTTGGFALLEIVVALGLLAVSTMVIVEALGAALEYLRAAQAAQRATAVAAAIAHTFDIDADYPTGWRVAGDAGPDALPGTRDDIPPDGSGIPCRRRITVRRFGGQRWAWVEASCVDAAPPAPQPAGSQPAGVAGGRLGNGALLLRGR